MAQRQIAGVHPGAEVAGSPAGCRRARGGSRSARWPVSRAPAAARPRARWRDLQRLRDHRDQAHRAGRLLRQRQHRLHGRRQARTSSTASIAPRSSGRRPGEDLSAADFALMASWHANVVRVALNQDFWLSDSPIADRLRGARRSGGAMGRAGGHGRDPRSALVGQGRLQREARPAAHGGHALARASGRRSRRATRATAASSSSSTTSRTTSRPASGCRAARRARASRRAGCSSSTTRSAAPARTTW